MCSFLKVRHGPPQRHGQALRSQERRRATRKGIIRRAGWRVLSNIGEQGNPNAEPGKRNGWMSARKHRNLFGVAPRQCCVSGMFVVIVAGDEGATIVAIAMRCRDCTFTVSALSLASDLGTTVTSGAVRQNVFGRTQLNLTEGNQHQQEILADATTPQ